MLEKQIREQQIQEAGVQELGIQKKASDRLQLSLGAEKKLQFFAIGFIKSDSCFSICDGRHK